MAAAAKWGHGAAPADCRARKSRASLQPDRQATVRDKKRVGSIIQSISKLPDRLSSLIKLVYSPPAAQRPQASHGSSCTQHRCGDRVPLQVRRPHDAGWAQSSGGQGSCPGQTARRTPCSAWRTHGPHHPPPPLSPAPPPSPRRSSAPTSPAAPTRTASQTPASPACAARRPHAPTASRTAARRTLTAAAAAATRRAPSGRCAHAWACASRPGRGEIRDP